MYDVAALGEVLIDFACKAVDDAGYPTLQANPGGAPCNFLAALSAYGAKTAFLGKVGEDAFGQMLLRTLRGIGVETKGILADPAYFTTLAFVTLDENGERTFSFARKPGADMQLCAAEVDESILRESRVFHFGTLSLTDDPARTATQKAVAYAKAQGCLITFDPNLRPPLWKSLEQAKTEILWGLRQADLVKISEEEVEFLWHCGVPEAAQKLLDTYDVQLVFITMGAAGCYYASRTACGTVHGPAVQPVDTTGAGDIVGGRALSRLLRLGKAPAQLTAEELKDIAGFACTAASLSTEKYGGITSIPAEAAVLAAMAAEKG